ncbi:hypothetical protein D9619_005415 [Psilocybe cf. subviscida]|uniref:BRCT domain-containing protein n=1 Tax=Psilocybe cf. subviscida TaxID=2480587 RepID=A0A8H5BWP8_9AGAR|nr:hypothetical protein D9619_005415 [Psilocybe cf. subviscida]
MPALDESDYIPSSGEEEDTRAAARKAENMRQHTNNASAASPTPSHPPQRAKNARQRRGRPVFRDKDDTPIGFFFDPSVRKQHKDTLSQHIRDRGGEVVLTKAEADTILVGLNYSERDLQAQQASYLHSEDAALRKIWVERTSFVKDCIDAGRFTHKRKRQSQQGFRTRTEYTSDDDMDLCKFLWRETVGNGGMGRTGLQLYKRMVSMAKHSNEHRWTGRHTAESWRNRYKKNQKRLDGLITKIAAETPAGIRLHFENNGRYKQAAPQEEEEPEKDSELEPESEDEEPPRQRRRTAIINKPRRSRRIAHIAASPSPRGSGPRLRRNAREREEEAEPESEEEAQEDELEDEMPQMPDALFDGPYDDLVLAGDNTQATLVNISAERHQDLNEHDPSYSDVRGVRKTGRQVDKTPATTQPSPLRPNVPARSEIPRKAARRPRPHIPASPPPEEQEDYMPQSSPIRQPENGHSSVQRQQDRARVPDMTNNPTPRNIDTQKERRQPFSTRRLTLPRPIAANPASPQASSSRVPPRQSMAQGRPAQGIYPVISPSHHIAPAVSTPVRRAPVSSSDSDSSNFPVPGTKADSMKKYLREEHIRTPYTAAPGTRAAAYLSQGM